MTTASTLDRLARPMPVTGRLGVITLWSIWLTAPAAILNAYTQWSAIWIPFFFVLFGAAIYAARTANTQVGGRVPSRTASWVGRIAPFIILAAVAIGFVISLIFAMPIATVIAGLVTLGFAAGITSTIAATPPRETHAD